MMASSPSHTSASEEKSCHASAISSAGSPTMTTGFAPSTPTTRTARPTSFGRTKAANQRGAVGVRAISLSRWGDTTVSCPIVSMTRMRTWRRCFSCKGSYCVELIELSLRREILGGGSNKALGNLERGLDLDTRRRSGIEDRNPARSNGGEQIDRAHRDEKLGSHRPVVPELLPQPTQVLKPGSRQPSCCGPCMGQARPAKIKGAQVRMQHGGVCGWTVSCLAKGLAGCSRKTSTAYGRGQIARSRLAIPLPNYPDEYWERRQRRRGGPRPSVRGCVDLRAITSAAEQRETGMIVLSRRERSS